MSAGYSAEAQAWLDDLRDVENSVGSLPSTPCRRCNDDAKRRVARNFEAMTYVWWSHDLAANPKAQEVDGWQPESPNPGVVADNREAHRLLREYNPTRR